MISQVDPTGEPVAAEIHAVAQAAYALEAEWIACRGFPPLRESVADLRESSDTFLVFRRSGAVLAALSYCRLISAVTVTRLVVHPAHLRQGIATALLIELEQRISATIVYVSTAAANLPAVQLYQRQGYTPVMVTKSAENIELVSLSKQLPGSQRSRTLSSCECAFCC